MPRALEITGTLPGGSAPAMHAWVRPGETLRWSRDPAALGGRTLATDAAMLLGPPSATAGDAFVVAGASEAQGWTVRVPAGARLVDAEGGPLGTGPLDARLSRGAVRLEVDGHVLSVRVVEAAPPVAAPRRVGVREVAALVGMLAPAAAALAGHAAPPAEEQGIEALLVELAAAERSVAWVAEPAPQARLPEASPVREPPPAEAFDLRLPAPPEDGRATLDVDAVLVKEGLRIEAPATPGCGVGGDGPVCMPWDLLADVDGWLGDEGVAWGHAGVLGTEPFRLDGEAARMLAEAMRAPLRAWEGLAWSARVHAPRVAGALREADVARPLGAIARGAARCDPERWDAWVVHVEASIDAAGAVTRATVAETDATAGSAGRTACIEAVVRAASFAPRTLFGVAPAPLGGPSAVRFTLAGRWR
jgi:hypothetical protein